MLTMSVMYICLCFLYIRHYSKVVEFKKYLHGASDAASRLTFKFRSGTHGLNEELGRRGREGCVLCDGECESVSHVLWEYPANSSLRNGCLAEDARG